MSRETDAKVAEAIGWGYTTLKHPSGDPSRDHAWKPSTVPADALAALDATGEWWEMRKCKGVDRWFYWCSVGDNTAQSAHDFCTAACAAILAWSAARQPGEERGKANAK